MSKGGYITAGLYKIKDQLDDAVPGTAKNPAGPVSVLDNLPEATRKAWLERRQEYERVRQDLRFRLQEFSSRLLRLESENRKNGEEFQTVRSRLTPLTERVENQTEPDEFSEDFQMVLGRNIREIDQIRLDLIDLQAQIPEAPAKAEEKSGNIFADLDGWAVYCSFHSNIDNAKTSWAFIRVVDQVPIYGMSPYGAFRQNPAG